MGRWAATDGMDIRTAARRVRRRGKVKSVRDGSRFMVEKRLVAGRSATKSFRISVKNVKKDKINDLRMAAAPGKEVELSGICGITGVFDGITWASDLRSQGKAGARMRVCFFVD
jgi:hypothetical protein